MLFTNTSLNFRFNIEYQRKMDNKKEYYVDLESFIIEANSEIEAVKIARKRLKIEMPEIVNCEIV